VAQNLPAQPAGFGAWLSSHFDHDAFKAIAQRCHGCGACASVCPAATPGTPPPAACLQCISSACSKEYNACLADP
jgi:ferredoxin